MISDIYKPDSKIYTVTRLDSLSTDGGGKQTANTTNHQLELSCYDKGIRLIRKDKEDSYKVATLHVYTDLKVLNLLDKFTFDNLNYTVLEQKNYKVHSFYKAIANV